MKTVPEHWQGLLKALNMMGERMDRLEKRWAEHDRRQFLLSKQRAAGYLKEGAA
jgi:hypothetical protein